jgi:hypothetical protein
VVDDVEGVIVEQARELAKLGDVAADVLVVVMMREIARPDVVAGRTQPVQEDLTDGAASARDQDSHRAPFVSLVSLTWGARPGRRSPAGCRATADP